MGFPVLPFLRAKILVGSFSLTDRTQILKSEFFNPKSPIVQFRTKLVRFQIKWGYQNRLNALKRSFSFLAYLLLLGKPSKQQHGQKFLIDLLPQPHCQQGSLTTQSALSGTGHGHLSFHLQHQDNFSHHRMWNFYWYMFLPLRIQILRCYNVSS